MKPVTFPAFARPATEKAAEMVKSHERQPFACYLCSRESLVFLDCGVPVCGRCVVDYLEGP